MQPAPSKTEGTIAREIPFVLAKYQLTAGRSFDALIEIGKDAPSSPSHVASIVRVPGFFEA